MPQAPITPGPETRRFRAMSLRLLFYGIALVILGAAIAWEIPRREALAPYKRYFEVRNGLRTLPLVAGTILTWVGGVRVSLLVRPVYAILLGLCFIVIAALGPVAVAQFVPGFRNFNWTVEYTLPIYALQIAGFILMSTGLLRFLSSNRYGLPR